MGFFAILSPPLRNVVFYDAALSSIMNIFEKAPSVKEKMIFV